MTGAPSSPPPGGRPPGSDGLWSWLRGLDIRRHRDGRWIAGVSTGVAQRFGIDPVLVRAGFVLLLVFGGFGLPLYLLAWALLPDDEGSIVAENAFRHGDTKSIVLVVVIGAVLLGNLSGKWWIWTILVPAAAVAYWVVRSARAGKSQEQMSAEASAAAARFGDTVSAWASRAGSPRPEHDTTTGPYAGPPLPAPGAPTAPGHPAPHGMGPGRTGTVTPPATTVIRRRRRRSGFLGLLLTVGLAVVGWAVGMQVLDGVGTSLGGRTVTPEVFSLGCALAGVGLALVVIGLMGRRAGFVGFLAVVLAVVAAVGTAGPSPAVLHAGVGDRTWNVADDPGRTLYELGAGDSTLDLTGVTTGQKITVTQGVGDMQIIVPEGVRAVVHASVDLGDLKRTTVAADGDRTTDNESDTSDSLGHTEDYTVGTGTTTVDVTASLHAGDMTIEGPASS